jgi:hypothetical protein
MQMCYMLDQFFLLIHSFRHHLLQAYKSSGGQMTQARAKALQHKVNSLLSIYDFDTPLDGMLLKRAPYASSGT